EKLTNMIHLSALTIRQQVGYRLEGFSCFAGCIGNWRLHSGVHHFAHNLIRHPILRPLDLLKEVGVGVEHQSGLRATVVTDLRSHVPHFLHRILMLRHFRFSTAARASRARSCQKCVQRSPSHPLSASARFNASCSAANASRALRNSSSAMPISSLGFPRAFLCAISMPSACASSTASASGILSVMGSSLHGSVNGLV